MGDKLLTVLTPVYNRGKYLFRIYDSLINQTNQNFKWVIVNDGSTDDTAQILEEIKRHNTELDIAIFIKENGGKHTAINYAVPSIDTDLVLILDSDDFLTNDAVQLISDKWQRYKNDSKICGFSFLKGKSVNEPLSSWYPKDEFVSNYIKFRINGNIKGDCCEVIKTTVLKEFPFKEFPKERFLTESSIWIPMALKYDTVYLNKVIYIADYLPDGLTKAGRRMQMNNPVGAMYAAKLGLDCKAKLCYKIKQAILYGCYGIKAGKQSKEIVKSSGHGFLVVLFLPIAFLFYKRWNRCIDT